MRIAIFGDVHGNKHALEAVLADCENQNPEKIFCLGDLVGYGAFPNEVIELISSRGIPTIMGNYDDGVGFDKAECGCAYKDPEMRRLGDLSLRWTQRQVTEENKAYLRSLLPQIRLEIEGHRLLLVHGSPRKINEYVYEDRPQWSLEHIADSAQSDVLVFGHTHLPYVKQVGNVLFVNPGSVGKPKDGDTRASYVIIDVSDKIVATIKRVGYDVASASAAVRASGLPERFAELLEQAKG
jgi:putative phosphoesterase